MKILFLIPYPIGKAPSQRFRFEQYFSILSSKNIDFKTQSFLDESTWKIIYSQRNYFRKIIGIVKGFLRRIYILFFIKKYEFIFIHRELTPIGPPIFEWIITKIFRKKVIYDFDDAIWLPNTSDTNRIIAFIKWHQKVKSICKWAYKVSAGNTYLCEYASQYNSNVILNPTTIDTEHLHNKVKNHTNQKVVIGWTGTHSTIKYLDEIIPIIQKLEKEHEFEFQVIADKNPSLPIKSFTFKPWNKENEIADLLEFNIGIMPLRDDAWAKGKCGFKALQYMALGIPSIVSPVGVNKEIIQHEKNGFICNSYDEWINCLSKLISDVLLRINIGIEARKRVIEKYSVQSNTTNFLNLFQD